MMYEFVKKSHAKEVVWKHNTDNFQFLAGWWNFFTHFTGSKSAWSIKSVHQDFLSLPVKFDTTSTIDEAYEKLRKRLEDLLDPKANLTGKEMMQIHMTSTMIYHWLKLHPDCDKWFMKEVSKDVQPLTHDEALDAHIAWQNEILKQELLAQHRLRIQIFNKEHDIGGGPLPDDNNQASATDQKIDSK